MEGGLEPRADPGAGGPGPTVSVVVPCYNLGAYLDDALDSVAAQTFGDFEVVVVDDGSTDPETRRVLSELDRPRTRIVRTENRGLPAARNTGVHSSSGPYVCCLDADDRLHPGWLEKAVAALAADPTLAFVSHWFTAFGDERWEWSPQRCDLLSLLDSNTVNGAALVRREVLERVGGFDESLREGCEDWELWLRVVAHGYRGSILPESLYEYRRRPGSMSRLLMEGGAYGRAYRHLLERHRSRFQEHYLELWLRKEARIAEALRHAADLERHHREWLEPEGAHRREEVERLRLKLEDVEREGRGEEERASLAAGVRELESAGESHHRLAQRVRELEAHVAGQQGRIRDLEGSLSWRLTAPLRALHAWLRGWNERG